MTTAPRAEYPVGSDSSGKIELWTANYAGAKCRLAVGLGVASDGSEPRVYLTLRGAQHLRRRLDRTIAALERRKVPRAAKPWPWCPLCGADSVKGAEGRLCAACDKDPACERCGARAVAVAGGMLEDGREWGGWHLCGPCSALAPGSRVDTFRRQPAADGAAVCAECGAPLDHPACRVGPADHKHCGCPFCAVCDEVPR